jgi:hypothetical protein
MLEKQRQLYSVSVNDSFTTLIYLVERRTDRPAGPIAPGAMGETAAEILNAKPLDGAFSISKIVVSGSRTY